MCVLNVSERECVSVCCVKVYETFGMGLVLLVYTHELVYTHSLTRTHAHTQHTPRWITAIQYLKNWHQTNKSTLQSLANSQRVFADFVYTRLPLCIFRRVISNVKCACAAHVAMRTLQLTRLRLVSGERFLWIFSPIRAPFSASLSDPSIGSDRE